MKWNANNSSHVSGAAICIGLQTTQFSLRSLRLCESKYLQPFGIIQGDLQVRVNNIQVPIVQIGIHFHQTEHCMKYVVMRVVSISFQAN